MENRIVDYANQLLDYVLNPIPNTSPSSTLV